jgi:hypothetical protein
MIIIMVKYIIEGGINFYEELYKSFDEPESNSDTNINAKTSNTEPIELCQITGIPLDDRHIVMECNHKFNYSALYKEIYKQKYIFRTYNIDTLSPTELIKFKNEKCDYFIKCPYCRRIQFTLLPYYEDMDHDKRYGINSSEKTQGDYNYSINANPYNYTFTRYGYIFNNGNCCKVLNNVDGVDIFCQSKMSSPILEMNKSFCYLHIREEVKQYKMAKQLKLKEELINKKLKDKEELLKAKEDIKNQKIKAKEDLKAQKLKEKDELKFKKSVVNTVSKQGEIQSYIPDQLDTNAVVLDTNAVVLDTNAVVLDTCQVILSSGKNKGQPCGNKIKMKNYCSRHCKLNN